MRCAVFSNQKLLIWQSISPLPGIGSGSTTSKAAQPVGGHHQQVVRRRGLVDVADLAAVDRGGRQPGLECGVARELRAEAGGSGGNGRGEALCSYHTGGARLPRGPAGIVAGRSRGRGPGKCMKLDRQAGGCRDPAAATGLGVAGALVGIVIGHAYDEKMSGDDDDRPIAMPRARAWCSFAPPSP